MFKTSPAKSEFVTRKEIIDSRLKEAGWKIVRFDAGKPLGAYERCAIEEYPTENGPADYALCVGGNVLGIVEAKKLTLGPQNVLTQAERYSKGIVGSPFDLRGFHVPFLYSSNGEVIWHHDIRHELNRSREIAGFHTPSALLEFMDRDFDTSASAKATARTHSTGRLWQTLWAFPDMQTQVSDSWSQRTNQTVKCSAYAVQQPAQPLTC